MPLDSDAGVAGSLAVGADGDDGPARPAAAKEDMADDRHHSQDKDVGRYAQQAAAAEPIPDAAVARRDRHLDRIGKDEQVQDRPENQHGDESRQESAKTDIADQNAVDGAHQGAGDERHDNRKRRRNFEHVEQHQRDEVGHGEDRADGEIDATRDDNDGNCDGDKAEFAELASRRNHVAE